MKFEELKKSLLEKVANAYMLKGVDEFLLSSSYNLIYKYSAIEMPDLNLIKFSEGIIDCADAIRALDTMPVFSEKKLVYMDLRMSRKSELKNYKDLDSYLKNPNQLSILVVNIGDNDDIDVFDKTNFQIVDCNKLDYSIVALKIKTTIAKKNKTIDDKAIKLLSDYCISDLSKILLEIDKLISYVGSRGTITTQDIEEIVTQSLEYQIFELTEALSKKNSKKVFVILNDMKAKKDEYKTLPALIYSHFRRLFMVSLNRNMSRGDLAKLLNVKEYAIKMTMAQIDYFSKSNLKKINELCGKLDFDLKQSNISIDNAINMLVLDILNM
jgi:DNA polymerase-3 subunit delta